jgi:hypothetical protein
MNKFNERLFGIWLLVIASMAMLDNCTSTSHNEVTQKRFMRMVEDKEVQQITIFNGQVVEVLLTPKALVSSKYQGLFGDGKQAEQRKSHFLMNIVSERAFLDDLAKRAPKFPVIRKNRDLFGFTS